MVIANDHDQKRLIFCVGFHLLSAKTFARAHGSYLGSAEEGSKGAAKPWCCKKIKGKAECISLALG